MKGHKKIYLASEYWERVQAHKLKLEERQPRKETWDEQELRARCELSKPNFNRASLDKQKEIRAKAMSRKLGRWL